MSNCDGGRIPLEMLQKKWTWCSYQQDRLLASPTVDARKNTTLEGTKAIGIPHHDCSPNYFSNKHCGSVAIFTNLQSLIIQSGLPGAVLMSPKAITSFNTVTQMKHSIFFYIMQKKFSISHYPVSYKTPENLFSSAQFLSSEVSTMYYKCTYLIMVHSVFWCH